MILQNTITKKQTRTKLKTNKQRGGSQRYLRIPNSSSKSSKSKKIRPVPEKQIKTKINDYEPSGIVIIPKGLYSYYYPIQYGNVITWNITPLGLKIDEYDETINVQLYQNRLTAIAHYITEIMTKNQEIQLIFLQNCPINEPYKNIIKDLLNTNKLFVVNDNNPCWVITRNHQISIFSILPHLLKKNNNSFGMNTFYENCVYDIFYLLIAPVACIINFYVNINIDYYIKGINAETTQINIIHMLINICIKQIKTFLNEKYKDNKDIYGCVNSIYFIGNFGRSIIYETFQTTNYKKEILYTIEKIKTTPGNKRYSMIDIYGKPYPEFPNINNNSSKNSNDTKYPEKKNTDCILKLKNINFSSF